MPSCPDATPSGRPCGLGLCLLLACGFDSSGVGMTEADSGMDGGTVAGSSSTTSGTGSTTSGSSSSGTTTTTTTGDASTTQDESPTSGPSTTSGATEASDGTESSPGGAFAPCPDGTCEDPEDVCARAEPYNVCTRECESTDDCPAAPAGASVPVSCSFTPGLNVELCWMHCNWTGQCPDGMVCNPYGDCSWD